MRIIPRFYIKFQTIFLLGFLLASCVQTGGREIVTSVAVMKTSEPEIVSTSTTLLQTPSPIPTIETAKTIWISNDLPKNFRNQFDIQPDIKQTEDEVKANITLNFLDKSIENKTIVEKVDWVYALVAPFKTVVDGISSEEFKETWEGTPPKEFKDLALFMTSETRQVLEIKYGKPAENAVKEVDINTLRNLALYGKPGWAVVPFEEIEPHWKVLKVDGKTPLSKKYKPEDYGLAIQITLSADPASAIYLQESANGRKNLLPTGNRDPDKLTVLMMTGTTCMVRYLALRMEENGVLYPAKDILGTLKDSDILHISNEASFYEECPPALPLRREARFCSDPKYFELLSYIGTSVVELTGNHILDWGIDPFVYTLNLYKAQNLPYYGGGINQDEARKPLLFEDHGNKIALMGCSPAGPKDVWATSNQPGSARCDYDYIAGQITDLKSKGYQVVFTFQHIELENYHPTSLQRVDFHHVADLGATIVSGSQSHFPQFMVFKGDSFIHYGLGNTFFDQMMDGNRRAFIDRHVFYNGKYISTELVSVILEDYARLRLMTDDERRLFLTDIFDASLGDRIFLNPPIDPAGQ